jgi:hypothetical protein
MSQHELAKIAFGALLNDVECEKPPQSDHKYETHREFGFETLDVFSIKWAVRNDTPEGHTIH